MYKAHYPCDLHTHSTRSDGQDSPLELVDHAAAAQLKILAITDHDIIPPETIEIDGIETSYRAYAAQKGIALIPGIEFSCDTQVEDVHIVALGCVYSHPFFHREYENSIQSKIDGYRQLCDILTQDGLYISWEQDILKNGERDERTVQRKFIFEAMAEKGYTRDWSAAKILVKNTPKYEVKRKKTEPTTIIEKIHAAGGIAILAHPFLISEKQTHLDGKKVSRKQYIQRLIEADLDGIEAAYPYDKTSYDGGYSPDEVEAIIRTDYEGCLKVISGGSDYHNDAKKGVKNPRLLGEKGVTMEYFKANPLLSALI